MVVLAAGGRGDGLHAVLIGLVGKRDGVDQDAFVARDVAMADELRQRDEEVDHMHNTLFRELLTHMMEDPRSITTCMHLLFIAKNLERIGDHVTGIAEQISYLVNGELPDDDRPKSDLVESISEKPVKAAG